jgi:hypothetical protein
LPLVRSLAVPGAAVALATTFTLMLGAAPAGAVVTGEFGQQRRAQPTI